MTDYAHGIFVRRTFFSLQASVQEHDYNYCRGLIYRTRIFILAVSSVSFVQLVNCYCFSFVLCNISFKVLFSSFPLVCLVRKFMVWDLVCVNPTTG